MITIEPIPKKCKHGGAVHLKVDPPIANILWSLSEGGKKFVDSEIKRTVPEIGFYVYRPRTKDGKQDQLKKGDIVTVEIKAGDAEVTGDIEVT